MMLTYLLRERKTFFILSCTAEPSLRSPDLYYFVSKREKTNKEIRFLAKRIISSLHRCI